MNTTEKTAAGKPGTKFMSEWTTSFLWAVGLLGLGLLISCEDKPKPGPSEYELTGQIVDKIDNPIPNIYVDITTRNMGSEKPDTTNRQGEFKINIAKEYKQKIDAGLEKQTAKITFKGKNITDLTTKKELTKKETQDLGVFKTNIGPTIKDTIPAQIMREGEAIRINLEDYVYNDDQSTYEPRNAGVKISDGNLTYSATKPETLETWISITDSADHSLKDSLLLRVLVPYINKAPVQIATIPNKTINEDETLTLNMSKYVKDREALTYTVSNLINAAYSTNKDTLRITPAKDYNGSIEDIIINASDGQASTELNPFKLSVTPVNDPPEFTGTIQDQTIVEDSIVTIDAEQHFKDIDGDALEYTIANLANATQTTDNGVITITPSENWSGTMTGLVIEATDGEYTAQSNQFSIEVKELPTVDIAFKFIAVYDDTLLTSGISTLRYRMMNTDGTSYVWDADSVATSGNGIITVQLKEGKKYSVRARHTNECDLNYKVSYYKIPGLKGTIAQEGLLAGTPYDSTNVMSFAAGTDTVNVYKIIKGFPIHDLKGNIDQDAIGTRRFSDSAIENLPFRGNLNWTHPDSAQRVWAQELIEELKAIPQTDINPYYYESTEIPSVPFVSIAFSNSFEYASNLAIFDEETNEINIVTANYKPYVDPKAFKQEIMEGIVDSNDRGGLSPYWVSSPVSGARLTTLGKQAICIVYLSKPKSLFR